jgi:hypothetical protein
LVFTDLNYYKVTINEGTCRVAFTLTKVAVVITAAKPENIVIGWPMFWQ